jgi:hypothetical protein
MPEVSPLCVPEDGFPAYLACRRGGPWPAGVSTCHPASHVGLWPGHTDLPQEDGLQRNPLKHRAGAGVSLASSPQM